MSIEQDREYYFLNQLVQSPSRSIKKFEGTATKPKELGLSGPIKKALEGGLLGRGFVITSGKGSAKQFTLTDAGLGHFKTLPRPEPPKSDPRVTAFVLLTLLATGDGQLTLKLIKSQFTPAIVKSLGFSKDGLPSLLATLVSENAISETASDGATKDEQLSYRLTVAGKRAVVRSRQHADIPFKLNGSVINQIIEFAAETSGTPSAARTMSTPTSSPENFGHGHDLTEDELIREGKGLMPSLGRNGLLPIFELRRHIRRKFGEGAVGREEFDLRLKRLRGARLELVSVHDPSMVGRDELNEGIQGAGELFFYVRDLR